jgi:hypothetical protein
MNLFDKLNVQTKIALFFSLVILLVIGGGIVTFTILSSLAWALPEFNTPEKFGPDLYGALARTRLTFALILFIEVLLLLPLGIGMMRTVSPRLKKDGEKIPLQNTANPLSLRVDEPAATSILEEIGALTTQMSETARNANEVMAHSLAVVRKGMAMSETTLEALKEHKKLTFKVTQLIEKITVGFQNQPESFH